MFISVDAEILKVNKAITEVEEQLKAKPKKRDEVFLRSHLSQLMTEKSQLRAIEDRLMTRVDRLMSREDHTGTKEKLEDTLDAINFRKVVACILNGTKESSLSSYNSATHEEENNVVVFPAREVQTSIAGVVSLPETLILPRGLFWPFFASTDTIKSDMNMDEKRVLFRRTGLWDKNREDYIFHRIAPNGISFITMGVPGIGKTAQSNVHLKNLVELVAKIDAPFKEFIVRVGLNVYRVEARDTSTKVSVIGNMKMDDFKAFMKSHPPTVILLEMMDEDEEDVSIGVGNSSLISTVSRRANLTFKTDFKSGGSFLLATPTSIAELQAMREVLNHESFGNRHDLTEEVVNNRHRVVGGVSGAVLGTTEFFDQYEGCLDSVLSNPKRLSSDVRLMSPFDAGSTAKFFFFPSPKKYMLVPLITAVGQKQLGKIISANEEDYDEGCELIT